MLHCAGKVTTRDAHRNENLKHVDSDKKRNYYKIVNMDYILDGALQQLPGYR